MQTFLSKAMTQKGTKVVNEQRATATSATFRFLNPHNPPQPALAAATAASVNSHQLTKANPRVKRDRWAVIANVFDSARVTSQESELKFSFCSRLAAASYATQRLRRASCKMQEGADRVARRQLRLFCLNHP